MTDWYKIKRVLIWQNWEEKQIYPAGWKPWENTIAYYPLNWNANDLSWNGNNGTASNITWNSWWDGGCASFNGSNSYISIPSLTTPSNTTINFRVKTTQSSEWEFIQLCSSTQSFEVRIISWKARLELWNNPQTPYQITGSTTINDWVWHNICSTKDWTSYILYVDWTQDSTGTSSFSMSYSNNRIWLHTNGSSIPFNWYIDNMIIESKARTAQETADYYNNTKSNYWL